MRARVVNAHKDKSLLTSVAESVGSTLGIIAAKANAVAGLAGPRPASKSRTTGKPAKARKSGSPGPKSASSNPPRSKSAGKARGSRGTIVTAGSKARAARRRSPHR
jgi:hypothetical protein